MPSFKELDISVNSDSYYEGATINNHSIKVKQYIPIEEKIEIATNVLKNSFDEKNSFANPFKVSVYFALEVIYHYTDIYGLEGIIKNKELWLSERNYMNDINDEKFKQIAERAYFVMKDAY